MKHLIIPTDFSLRSLEPVRAAITHFAGEPIVVTLLHLLEPPTDILDGLRLAYRTDSQPSVPRAFELAVESVGAVYVEQIHGIRVKMCYGSTAAAVRNLLEHFGADAVVFDPRMPFELPASNSIDPRPVLRRAMPRNIVETGNQRATATAASPASSPLEASVISTVANKRRLQPAAHDATGTFPS